MTLSSISLFFISVVWLLAFAKIGLFALPLLLVFGTLAPRPVLLRRR